MSIARNRRAAWGIALAVGSFGRIAAADDPSVETVLPVIEIRVAPPAPVAAVSTSAHHDWTNRTGHAVLDPLTGLMIPPGFTFPYAPPRETSREESPDGDGLVLDPQTGLWVPASRSPHGRGRSRQLASATAPTRLEYDASTGLLVPHDPRGEVHAPVEPPHATGASMTIPTACRHGATLALDRSTGLMIPCASFAPARH